MEIEAKVVAVGVTAGDNTAINSGRESVQPLAAPLTTSAVEEQDMAGPKSSTGRSPAFQFYPTDFLADPNVIVMGMAERGIYITLISICWQQGALPADTAILARLCQTPISSFKKLWPSVERCFRLKNERLIHPRLEEERRKQSEYREKQAENGKKGGRPHKATGSEKGTQNKAVGFSGLTQTEPKESSSSSVSDLQSSSSDSSQKTASFADARSKRPIFKGNRFVVFEWQFDDLRRMLGSHCDEFDLHGWFDSLDQSALAANLVVPQKDGGKWLSEQTQAEAVRRGLPVAATLSGGQGKTAGNLAAAARFVARGQA